METKRIRLRNFRPEDLADFYAYAKIDGLGEAAGWRHLNSLEEAQAELPVLLDNPFAYALEDKSSGKVIGHLTIHDEDENHNSFEKELGFVLHPDFRRQGIMREVVQMMIAELFQHGIEKIFVGCLADNLASENLIKKLGFVFDKPTTYFSSSLNQTLIIYQYVMTKEDYDRGKEAHNGNNTGAITKF